MKKKEIISKKESGSYQVISNTESWQHQIMTRHVPSKKYIPV